MNVPPAVICSSSWPISFRRDRACSPGFSLIELLVVIAIIGILAAVGVTAY